MFSVLQGSLIPQFHQLWSCSSLGLHFAAMEHLLRKIKTTLITMVWCWMILMFDWSNGEICDSFEIWIWMHFVRVTRPELIGRPTPQCHSNYITLHLHLPSHFSVSIKVHWHYIYIFIDLFLSDPSPIIGFACQWLTHSLTHSLTDSLTPV